MADTFKNSSLDVTNTDLTAVYTVPAASPGVTGTAPTFPTTGVVKSIIVASDSANATLVDIKYLDSSATATFVLFNQKSISANTTVELLEQPLVFTEALVVTPSLAPIPSPNTNPALPFVTVLSKLSYSNSLCKELTT